ncbi:8384_t:CDS:2, partial [Paraglomus occultum]
VQHAYLTENAPYPALLAINPAAMVAATLTKLAYLVAYAVQAVV